MRRGVELSLALAFGSDTVFCKSAYEAQSASKLATPITRRKASADTPALTTNFKTRVEPIFLKKRRLTPLLRVSMKKRIMP